MKKLFSMVLAAALLISCVGFRTPYSGVALAESAIEAMDNPAIFSHDGRVTLIEGSCVDSPVNSFDDAAQVVNGVLDQLGGDERTELVPWRTLIDAYGNRYFVFQQMCNDTTVLGGAVKVIADEAGNMLGLTSSIVSELPEAEDAGTITAEAAERVVLDHVQQNRQQTLRVMDGLTAKMILPIALEIDIEAEDDGGGRYVWVVYTDNPDAGVGYSADLPYLAHYVTLAGEYLYSLPTIMPGDEVGESGFDSSYVFEFMEPVDYSGFVDLSTGGEREITVSVMRDKRTGMYYLGNLERRIVVASCYEFLYDGGRVVLESSPDNLEWDQVGLMSLYNYCRAYDYYKAIGWSGGDGEDTPILILNNFCDANHTPIDNAAYAGKYLGWQIFLASQANDFSQCLDVLGHEFTHCVTGSVMTYNAYMNDYGAINEAMSDIQGKTCQMLTEGAENVSWELGDEGLEAVRSMSEPHRYQQPEFAWDVYYMPNVKTPTELNDRGGVHANSSLLNQLAWMLYEDGGMTLEEGRAFWFTVDCAMVPGTDYPQLAELLPWAMSVTGLETYADALRKALDATRLGVNAMPEAFDQNRALLSLDLPDNEVFNDEQWVMQLVSVDVDKLIETVRSIVAQVMLGDLSVLPLPFRNTLADEAPQPDETSEGEEKGFLEALIESLFNEDMTEEDTKDAPEVDPQEDALRTELMEWFEEYFKGVLYYGSTNAGQDGHSMRIVSIPGYAVPLLIHGVWNDKTSTLEEVYLLGYLGNRWIDLGGALNDIISPSGEDNAVDDTLEESFLSNINDVMDRLSDIHSLNDVLDIFFYRISGGEINELPGDGLDAIRPQVSGIFDAMEDESVSVQPRMSRPRLDETRDAA